MSLPRILLGAGADTMDHATHRRVHGDLAAGRRRSREGGRALLDELTRSGLRGRGGGAFPLAAKLASVQRAKGRAVVVANGTEGEPMSVKDRMLLEALPHLVLDGAYCLADVLGTEDIVIALDESMGDAHDTVRRALRERPEAGRRRGRLRIVSVPAGYVTGHETAIVNFVNRGIPRPLTQPPRISERGVGRRPTLMSNAETLAHVALIARHGADWFRRLGRSDEPGSALVTLSGGVSAPGVYEIELGSRLDALVRAGGGVAEPVRAFLVGGYAGTWIDAAGAAPLPLSRSGLRALGAALGAGIVVALPRSACPVAEVTRVAGWMADQGASQCGPCVNGLASIADTLADVSEGRPGRDAFADILRWSELVVGRGACAHPDGAAAFVTSALRVFSAEFDDHARHGRCDACARRPVLITPRERSLVA
ncbi:MAG TPA: NADH-ubiquinone oxidoreductase-F iron-sulfur binding region domain-containing protein [Solirubrobacteraceae bacterium]|jgi:NADH:ubiquinone oxidoreductase subunit F (NADH-binding)|nr:NADH-ubiquinone oxidoreductase-F iron-sulfur binding region domain-containing protein [Solirubrobacteraceae bacterium]